MRDPYRDYHDKIVRYRMELEAELKMRHAQEEFLAKQQRDMLSAVLQVPSMLTQSLPSGAGGGENTYAVYTQDRAEPLERIVARPDHYCTTGDAGQTRQDCTRCMDKLYGSTTGRPVPSGYHGWRDEYATHGTPYAFERMMGLVDENTEDVLTAKAKPAAIPGRSAPELRAGSRTWAKRAIALNGAAAILCAVSIVMGGFLPVLILWLIFLGAGLNCSVRQGVLLRAGRKAARSR